MGILGKDLFDLQRPLTHTKILFGESGYWIEDNPKPLMYGDTLLAALEYDARGYIASVDRLNHAVKNRRRSKIIDAFCDTALRFVNLPLYREYLLPSAEEEIRLLKVSFLDGAQQAFIDCLLNSSEKIMKNFLWARDDIRMIQERYAGFIDGLLKDQEPEKKKGQRKLPLAAQLKRQNLDALVSGRSLGLDRKVDAPQVNVQYMIHSPREGDPEVVEKMYFDRLLDFVYVEFMKGIQKGYIPKRCQNCGQWFLQEPGATFSYCNRIAPGETEKTCRDIGAMASFQAKVQNNEVWKIHQRAYKKYYARVMKKTMTKAEFEAWARDAERLRDAALAEYESLSPEDRQQLTDGLAKELNKL